MSPEPPPPERGYGAIEDITLRILFLIDPDKEKDGREMSKAVGVRHSVTVLCRKGFFSRFAAARAAADVSPQLVHAVGLGGVGAAGVPLGLAKNLPVILSLSLEDIQRRRSVAIRASQKADAVVLDSREAADALKDAGVERELYVTSTPNGPEEAPNFLGSIEIVYGRVADRRGITERAPEQPEIIQLGGLKKL